MKTQHALETAPLPYPQTPESANAWFVRHGICKSHWAEAQGIDRMTLVDLLRGRLKGLRGEAHHAAIALGLKADPNTASRAA
jgi:gp16 family phage-associated protein